MHQRKGKTAKHWEEKKHQTRMGTGRKGVSHSAERAADTSRASNDQLLPKPNVTHALELHLQNATNPDQRLGETAVERSVSLCFSLSARALSSTIHCCICHRDRRSGDMVAASPELPASSFCGLLVHHLVQSQTSLNQQVVGWSL
ncbi:hypothetical protein D4764_13G0011530 [Takifugu flavidus]|uniref:Uncharacterized protein n=1 Tax=Takifugu flavidus TaxID=433684 RepID=A0A5C6PCP4_9TELE|nr:hypothetical protein D4764_13G0011530 [Takifugu flavidus]